MTSKSGPEGKNKEKYVKVGKCEKVPNMKNMTDFEKKSLICIKNAPEEILQTPSFSIQI